MVESGLLHQLRLPNQAQTTTVGYPVKLSGYDFQIYRQPPLKGEHTAELFDEWGV
ncbi:hypothetical protein D3C73_732950 [compost metagenome]